MWVLEKIKRLREGRAAVRQDKLATRRKLAEIYEVIGDVEGRKLDEQQVSCIAEEVHNHLVVAGAGTGKTTTIVGRIKYLLNRKVCRFDEILVLSFTNASAAEMRERIRKETGQEIAASTFHKLGLEIIKAAAVFGVGAKVKITKIDLAEFVKKRFPEEDEGFWRLAESVINLMKSKNLESRDFDDGDEVMQKIKSIFDEYQKTLRVRGEIDFNDMINLATKCVREGKYLHKYTQVIVDEYQDISEARFGLLKALRETRDYTLFAVGDDWQSIYRFAGSDIGFILKFGKYWGETKMSKIETTYRSPQRLIDIAGKFVMKNPKQVKKAIWSKTLGYDFPMTEIAATNEMKLVELLADEVLALPKNSTIYFIGRYNFDIKLPLKSRRFECGFADGLAGDVGRVIFRERPDLVINFITAHRSKGLEADYVFILNNKNSTAGFPSRIENEPILERLLENSDDFPEGEERRLFYVAMTRARKKVFLLTLKGQESDFVRELRREYGNRMRMMVY